MYFETDFLCASDNRWRRAEWPDDENIGNCTTGCSGFSGSSMGTGSNN